MAIVMDQEGLAQVGSVNVVTSSDGGLPVEHWAERLLSRIVYVADDSASPIKDQALEFKDDIRQACEYYMKAAIQSDRTTIYNMLLKQGEPEMAEIIRRLK
jgi:hypothetical protein